MNRFLLIISLVIGVVVTTNNILFAQASATASSSVSIVTPISIAKTLDMNFGNIAASGTAGTVILAPAGTRTKTGGVTLPVTAGTVTAATFTVSGQASFTYSITLPGSAITLANGGNNMSATTFTSTPTPTGTLSAGGTQTITVGATLTVGANQVAGTYTTATPFTVTVNYND